MVNKGNAAGALYVWQDTIEGYGEIHNPHYSFDDVEESIERRLRDDTKKFLKNKYLSEVETNIGSEHYELSENGKKAAFKVYGRVKDRHNGDLDSFMDWEDEETVEELLGEEKVESLFTQ